MTSGSGFSGSASTVVLENTVHVRKWESSEAQLLLDEVEDKKNTWVAWYNRRKRIVIGLNFGYTLDQRPDFRDVTAKAMLGDCDLTLVFCCNFLSNDLFNNLLTSEPGITCQELLIQQKAGFWTTLAAPIAPTPTDLKQAIKIGALPQITQKLDDKLVLKKTIVLLQAQLEYYLSNYKVADVLLEANQTSEEMSLIVHAMLRLVRIGNGYESSTLLVQMNLGLDSNETLNWFRQIRRSANNERNRLRPVLRLGKELPDDVAITAWVKARVAYVSLPTDLFVNVKNKKGVVLPHLPSPRHRTVLLKLMECGANVLIEPKADFLELNTYFRCINNSWTTFLKLGRPFPSVPRPPRPRLVSTKSLV